MLGTKQPTFTIYVLILRSLLSSSTKCSVAKMLASQFLVPVRTQRFGANKQGCTCAVSGTSLTAVLILQRLPVTQEAVQMLSVHGLIYEQEEDHSSYLWYW